MTRAIVLLACLPLTGCIAPIWAGMAVFALVRAGVQAEHCEREASRCQS